MHTPYLALLVATFVPMVIGRCPFIKSPRYGNVDCTDSNKDGSVCTLSCQEYYDLAGTKEPSKEAVCEYGSWSIDTDFACDAIKCYPEHQMPENGDLICTADNLMASLCVYYCSEHYDMQGVDNDRTAFSTCKDDGDGDAIGYWTNDEGIPHPPVCELMHCGPTFEAPENGKVICSADDAVGSNCIVHCNPGYDLVGEDQLVLSFKCTDDNDYDNMGIWTRTEAPTCRKKLPGACEEPPLVEGVTYECDSYMYQPGTVCTVKCLNSDEQVFGDPDMTCSAYQTWEASSGEMPVCKKCTKVSNAQIVALIHSENDRSKFVLAAKLITRLTTLLKRKVKLDVELRATRYNSDVYMDGEFLTSSFDSKRDKSILEDLPFAGSGENIENALQHASKYLTEDGKAVQVVLIITDELTPSASATAVADDLRNRGVVVACVGMKEKKEGETDYDLDDFEDLTGSSDLVFEIWHPKSVEIVKSRLATAIEGKAVEKGCKKSKGS